MTKFAKPAFVAALVAIAATPAAAVDATLSLTATVPLACTLGTPSQTTLNLSSPATAGSLTSSAVTTTMTMICNGGSNIEIKSAKGTMTPHASEAAAITAATPVPDPSPDCDPCSDFPGLPSSATNRSEYTVQASGTGIGTRTLNTKTAPNGPATSGVQQLTSAPVSTTMTVAVTPIADPKLLIAGTYTDTLTISITPFWCHSNRYGPVYTGPYRMTPAVFCVP